MGCCCSVFGLAASSARLAIHASYSGVPRRGGVSAGRPPIACGIKSPTCTLLQDGSDRTARQRNADLIGFATRLISDFMPSDCGARRTSRCCAAVSSPAASARPDRSGDTSRLSNPADRAKLESRPRLVSTNKGGAGLPPPLVTESSSRVPRDDARMELCGAGFAFSGSGDLCLFSGFRRNQSRVGGSCGGSVAA